MVILENQMQKVSLIIILLFDNISALLLSLLQIS